ncbi:MAG TPA: sigma-54-dependent Fis family transcriptional regulator [bacterium]|nr:sigma-54-dependent Fis family transcriptional regulator [bacterium]
MNEREKRILILDDEEMIRDLLHETFQKKGFFVETAMNGKEALDKVEKNTYDLVVTDLRLPDISGMDVLTRVKKKHPEIGIIMITAYGSIKNAVKAMKQGAFDYIAKPFNLDEMEVVVEKYFKYKDLVDENRYLRSELDRKFHFKNIIGNSEPMQRIFESIKMVANTRATVLIQGESGTGKELVARAIHYNSDRKNGPFITTNCAALPEGLVESELFGHEKGAFTGAYKTSKGRFEMAHMGTLLLDEISEIGFGLQAKLLRVLQEREIERVGGGRQISVDVRIIATTNRNLHQEVEEKRFREDLYYRLNVVPIRIPTIAERRDDIPLLVRHFVNYFCNENGIPVKEVSEKTMHMLSHRDWPGNVREIENSVERAVVMTGPDVKTLEPKHFIISESPDFSSSRAVSSTKMTLREAEKDMILNMLKEHDNNRTKAAELLGISVRTLRNKLNEYRKEGVAI